MGSCSSTANGPAPAAPSPLQLSSTLVVSQSKESDLGFSAASFPSKPNEYDYLFKFLLIGGTGAGKSSLIIRFAHDDFQPTHISTIGVDFKIKTLVVDGKRIKLQIWDTAGQERFKTVTNAYFRGTHGIVVVYDITSTESYDSARYWHDELEKFAPKNALKLLIGNKLDLEEQRAIQTADATAFAQENSMLFIEASAKDSTNVHNAFVALASAIKERIK
eukprot:TRINITY_DN10996_c0_g1_i1.p1 TRINITY_DN10996_c0_g1~~TRINITY_DN10996_c0_g1_i1.p1  ORF type:complete len:219 (-),score=58.17 TRINITY_DN10996_c0_g1_i1:89-745(-)